MNFDLLTFFCSECICNSYLMFRHQDSNEIHFRVKMSTQMYKLKRSYSEKAVSVPCMIKRLL